MFQDEKGPILPIRPVYPRTGTASVSSAPSAEAAAQPRAEPRAALSRQLSEFLIEFSIGVHRYGMYPPGHPSLAPVVDNIVGRLGDLFEERRSLSIGVARRQLVIEGTATDQKHPVLSDLAKRLHEHQIAALTFEFGVTASEIDGLLAALAGETRRDGTPIGLLAPDEIPDWPHAHLYPVGYDQLELRREGGSGSGKASDLWLGLAQAALARGHDTDDAESSTLARAIAGHHPEAAYDQVIAGYLRQLAEELKSGSGEEQEKIRQRVSALISELDDPTLERLVEMGGNVAHRRRFLLDANQSLAVDAVMKMLQAAARSSRQSISTSMTRLLTKLATHAQEGKGQVRSQATTALRENVERLIDEWTLEDPNPESYTQVLDAMARAAPLFQAPEETEDHVSGDERMIQLAIEVDTWGPMVERSVERLLETPEGGTRIMELLVDAPPGNEVAERIHARLSSPEAFRRLVEEGRVDDQALRRLTADMGEAALGPLLDVLAESGSRSVRRRIFDILSGMGPGVAERAVQRLQDERWFVVRNMLALLHRLDHLPADFDAIKFLVHPDARVRREALPLALANPVAHDRALARTLVDPDERILRMGLLALEDHLPEALIPTLIKRVLVAEKRSPEVRGLAARILAGTGSSLAKKSLLELAVGGKSVFGKLKLKTGPTALAALRGLAAGWPTDPEVVPVLAEARSAKDPETRLAVRVEAKPGTPSSGERKGGS